MTENEASRSLAALNSNAVLDSHTVQTPVTTTHSPQSHITSISSSSTTSSPPPARPRFRDPPPTPAPIPPPPTRYARCKRAVSATPPFCWFAKLDWRSGEQLEKGLVHVLTSHEENAVPEYRRVVLNSFRNRLVLEVTIAVGILLAVLRVWTSNDFLVIMWLVIILSSIIVNQYLMMRRILYIIDHSEMHAGYVRELSARLNGGVYPDQPFLTANERRYSDDPLYLPEPPPVYNLATSVPPAYNSPPSQPKAEESGCTIQMSEYPRSLPPSRPLPPPTALMTPPGLADSIKPSRSNSTLSEAGGRSSRQPSSDNISTPTVNGNRCSDDLLAGNTDPTARELSSSSLASLIPWHASAPAPSSPTAPPSPSAVNPSPLTGPETTITTLEQRLTGITDPNPGDINHSAIVNSADHLGTPILSIPSPPSLSLTLSSDRISNRSFPYLPNSSSQGRTSIETLPTSSQDTLTMPEQEFKNKSKDAEA